MISLVASLLLLGAASANPICGCDFESLNVNMTIGNIAEVLDFHDSFELIEGCKVRVSCDYQMGIRWMDGSDQPAFRQTDSTDEFITCNGSSWMVESVDEFIEFKGLSCYKTDSHLCSPIVLDSTFPCPEGYNCEAPVTTQFADGPQNYLKTNFSCTSPNAQLWGVYAGDDEGDFYGPSFRAQCGSGRNWSVSAAYCAIPL